MLFFLLLTASQPQDSIAEKIKKGMAYFHAGQYKDAQQFLNTALEGRMDDIQFIEALVYLGASLDELSQHEQAQKILESCIQNYRENKPKPDDEAGLAFALMHIGKVYSQRGQYPKSESTLEESILLFNQSGEVQKAQSNRAKTLLAETYMYGGKYKEAESCFKDVIDQYDPNDSQVLWTSLWLGRLYMFTDQFKEAKSIFEKGVERLKNEFASDKDKLGWNITYPGDIYRFLKLFGDSEKAMLEGLKAFKDCGDDDNHQITQWCNGYLGRLYCDWGKYDQVEPLLENCVEVHTTAIYGEESKRAAPFIHALANTYANTNEFEKAEQLFKACISIYEKHFGIEHAEYQKVLHDYDKFKVAERIQYLHDRINGIPEYKSQIINIPSSYFLDGGEWRGLEAPKIVSENDLRDALKKKNEKYQGFQKKTQQPDFDPFAKKNLEDATATSHVLLKKDGFYYKFLNLTKFDSEKSDEEPQNEFICRGLYSVLNIPELIAETVLLKIRFTDGSEQLVQASRDIEGSELNQEHLDGSIDPDIVSQQFIISILLGQGDAKFDNYKVQNGQVISIDNEMSQRKPWVYREARHGNDKGIYSVLREHYSNQFRISPKTAERFKKNKDGKDWTHYDAPEQIEALFSIFEGSKENVSEAAKNTIMYQWYQEILFYKQELKGYGYPLEDEALFWQMLRFYHYWRIIGNLVCNTDSTNPNEIPSCAELFQACHPDLVVYENNEPYYDGRTVHLTLQSFYGRLLGNLSELIKKENTDFKSSKYINFFKGPIKEFVLGWLYYKTQDSYIARDYFENVVKKRTLSETQFYQLSCYYLGNLYQNEKKELQALEECYKKALSVPKANYKSGKIYERQKEMQQAENAYLLAAKEGHPAAQYKLGKFCEQRGDKDTAKQWYKKADRQWDASATYKLAIIYKEKGKVDKARKYLLQSAGFSENGSGEILCILKTKEDGEKSSQKGKCRKDYDAQMKLWEIISNSEKRKDWQINNSSLAPSYLLEKFAEYKNPKAQFKLAQTLLGKGYLKRAQELLKNSEGNNNHVAQFEIAKAYRDGKTWGFPKDPCEAIKYLKKAAGNDNFDAQFELAKALRDGQDGVWEFTKEILETITMGVEKKDELLDMSSSSTTTTTTENLPDNKNTQGNMSETTKLQLAKDWLIRSVNNGNYIAQLELAKAYRDGPEGTWGFETKDPVSAESHLRDSAHNGNYEAQLELAKAHRDDETSLWEFLPNLEEAKKLLKGSASSNFEAKLELAKAHRDGITSPWNLPKDPEEAKELLKESIKMGNYEAQFELAKAYRDGPDGLWEFEKKNPGFAQKELIQSADNSNYEAQFELAKAYRDGPDGLWKFEKKELKLAQNKLEESAENDNHLAQFELAKALKYGETDSWKFQKDPEKALNWLEKSAKNGNHDAQFALACEVRSVELLKKYSKKGNTKAMDKLVDLVKEKTCEKTVLKDLLDTARNYDVKYTLSQKIIAPSEEALPDQNQIILKAAKNGNNKAQYKIAEHYFKNSNFEKARKWLEKAACNGNYAAQYIVAEALVGEVRRASWKFNQDKEKAREWLKKSVRNGNYNAQLDFSKAYLDKNNRWGLKPDPTVARGLLMDYTTKWKNHKALYEISKAYLTGKNQGEKYSWGFEKNNDEALKNLEWAAEAGNSGAQFDLVKLYADERVGVKLSSGKYVSYLLPPNIEKARNWLKKVLAEGRHESAKRIIEGKNMNEMERRIVKKLFPDFNTF